MRDYEAPRYALVVWKGGDECCCIPLEDVPAALNKNAMVFAREDEDCMPCARVEIDPAQSNPRRQADGDDGA